jgi:hypothetical protein
MSQTLTELCAPALIRGDLIEQDLVMFGGRGGAPFLAPEPRSLTGLMPLHDPSRLRDVQTLPFDEIVAYLDELGRALELGRNAHLQQALEASEHYSDMTAPLVRASFEQLPALFSPDSVREVADSTIGIPYL